MRHRSRCSSCSVLGRGGAVIVAGLFGSACPSGSMPEDGATDATSSSSGGDSTTTDASSSAADDTSGGSESSTSAASTGAIEDTTTGDTGEVCPEPADDCEPLRAGEVRLFDPPDLERLAWVEVTLDDRHVLFWDTQAGGVIRSDLCGEHRYPIVAPDDHYHLHVVQAGAALVYQRNESANRANDGLWTVPITPSGCATAEPVAILDLVSAHLYEGVVRDDATAAFGWYALAPDWPMAAWRLVDFAAPDMLLELPIGTRSEFRPGTAQVTWTEDGAVWAWDLELRTTELLGDLVAGRAHAWSPDGAILYTVPDGPPEEDPVVFAYDIGNQVVEEIAVLDTNAFFSVEHLAVSPSGAVLAVTLPFDEQVFLIGVGVGAR